MDALREGQGGEEQEGEDVEDLHFFPEVGINKVVWEFCVLQMGVNR